MNKDSENIRYGMEAVGAGLQLLGVAVAVGEILSAIINKMPW